MKVPTIVILSLSLIVLIFLALVTDLSLNIHSKLKIDNNKDSSLYWKGRYEEAYLHGFEDGLLRAKTK